jgi:glycerophosphoryl diester phosphodiesterase
MSDGKRSVISPIEPISGFKTVPGFFNIAHRGASHYAPENTFAAFELAEKMGADMIELDVTLTRDHVPVVIHDSDLKRTTDGSGPITNFLEREIAELDAGSWFSPEFQGSKIPILEDVLAWAKGRILLNIEIKKEAFRIDERDRITGLIHELIESAEATDKVIVSSFSDEALKDFRNLSPDTATAYLMNPYSISPKKTLRMLTEIGAEGLNLQPYQMSSRLMSFAGKERLPVWVYTVNDAADMIRVIKKGGSGIFTNRPELLNDVTSQLFKKVEKEREK